MDYSITLDLRGNILEKLNLVENKLDSINKKSKKVRVSGGAGSPASPSRRSKDMERYSRIIRGLNFKFRHNPFLDFSKTFANFEKSMKARKRFMDNFWSNSTSISGARRNLGNFINMFGKFSQTLLTTIPALGVVTKGIAAIFGTEALGALAGGLLYKFGKKSLLGEGAQTAIQNAATYNMVKLTRGESGFNSMYKTATDISERTGAGRAGTMALMNTLSGLTVGKTKLTDRDATFFANVAAKISAVSGKDMQIVGLNLQQLLTTWQGIDMKELFKSVPLIEKYVFDLRANSKNKGEDIYDFIRKNPDALVDSFAKFADVYKLDKLAIATGQMKLSEENLNLSKNKSLENFYIQVAELSVNINKMLEGLFEAIGKVDWKPPLDQFQSFMEGLIDFTVWITNALGSIDWENLKSILKWGGAGAALGSFGGPLGTLLGGVAGGLGGYLGGGSDKDIKSQRYKVFKYSVDDRSNQYRAMIVGFTSPNLYRDKEGKLLSTSTPRMTERIQLTQKEFLSLFEKLAFSSSKKVNDLLAKINSGDLKALEESVIKYVAEPDNYKPTVTPGAGDADKLQNLTRGSRSLIINFNKEIVSMTNNMQPNDTESLLREMESVAEDAVTRGLHIAFNNSTLAASTQ